MTFAGARVASLDNSGLQPTLTTAIAQTIMPKHCRSCVVESVDVYGLLDRRRGTSYTIRFEVG